MITEDASERQSAPIHVFVAITSGVLLEIVMQTLQQQPDIVITHLVNDPHEIDVVIKDQTDVLILSAPYVYPPPQICSNLWHSFPTLKILVMTPNGDTAVIYRLHLHQHRLKTVAAHTLVRTIRRVQQLDLTDDKNVNNQIREYGVMPGSIK